MLSLVFTFFCMVDLCNTSFSRCYGSVSLSLSLSELRLSSPPDEASASMVMRLTEGD